KAEPAQVRRAAITAISAVPGHDVETFNTLSALAKSGVELPAAVASLQRLPKKAWPRDQAEPLLESLADYLRSVPVDKGPEPGALEEIGQAAEKMLPEPDANSRLYVPQSPKVLQATRLLDPGQKAKLAFTAPDEPGDYPYLCTYPGHWRRMVGTLAVARDVEAY